jgi:hypothetical protein
MNNKTLSDYAKELENKIRPIVGCYVVVGWVREPSGNPHLVVYIDRKVDAVKATKAIPDYWHGVFVDVQAVYPPGTRPPEPEKERFPNWVF